MGGVLRANFLAPDSPRWHEVLSCTAHDFYHLPDYVRLCSRQEGGEALAFLAEENGNRFLVPFILRPIDLLGHDEDQLWDVTCPYGYPSPLLATNRDRGTDAFLERAVDALLEGLRQLNVVSAFFRLHPILALPVEPLARTGHVVQHGETVYVDLTLPAEEIWRQTRSNHRRGINRAKREGHVGEIDERWEEFDTFVDIYGETMRRVGAHKFYYFTRDYFAELRQALGDRLHLCVVRIGGEVACAGLFSEVCGIVEYHLGGTREKFLANYPTKIMFDFVRYWAKGRGNRVLHLGGGLGSKEDSLFHFKAGFSNLRRPFFSWRGVVNERAYSALIERYESSWGVQADGFRGFFPAYRKPISIESGE